jgi:hypothetical protein
MRSHWAKSGISSVSAGAEEERVSKSSAVVR